MNSLIQKGIFVCTSCLFLFGLVLASTPPKSLFQSEKAFQVLVKLQENGARTPGSFAHKQSVDFISSQLEANGWQVQIQSGTILNHPVKNIIATRNPQNFTTILATHYDSRLVADKDPDFALRSYPVPGANDGGSSTAVLLELSRVLDPTVSSDIALVFFDIEDQGNIEGWEWILGSRYYVQQMETRPEKMILLDMVGGFDQTIVPPVNSDVDIYKEIRDTSISLGYGDYFSPPSKHGILDDHVPFLETGILAVDLIDIRDARWHTASDDLENVSSQSLQRVGDTLYTWIVNY